MMTLEQAKEILKQIKVPKTKQEHELYMKAISIVANSWAIIPN